MNFWFLLNEVARWKQAVQKGSLWAFPWKEKLEMYNSPDYVGLIRDSPFVSWSNVVKTKEIYLSKIQPIIEQIDFLNKRFIWIFKILDASSCSISGGYVKTTIDNLKFIEQIDTKIKNSLVRPPQAPDFDWRPNEKIPEDDYAR